MRWLFSGLLFLIFSFTASAQEFNAGFVQGLWYDSDQVFAQSPTRIYVAIRNNTGADITGTVEFFDNDVRIERNNVSALDGRIIESWADWTPEYGEHTITATLSRIELHKVGSTTEAIEVVSASASDTFFVDFDTDNDGLSNQEDNDDDGDGISDEEEDFAGTNPLDANDPPATVNDDDVTEDDNATTEDSDNNESNTQTNTDNQGLEQFLEENKADSAFTTVTNVINDLKQQIDDYRASRNSNNEVVEESDIENQNEAGVAEESDSQAVTSSTNQLSSIADTSSLLTNKLTVLKEPSLATTEKDNTEDDSGFFSAAVGAIGTVLNSIYTFLLFLLSVYLGHPVIVQLTLIFLILFLVYKLSKRLGARRNY